jgi:hypothetical protein
MTWLSAAFAKEPTMILSLVSAFLALVVGYGVPVSTQQMGLIMAFVTTAVGLINRLQVTSPATLQAMTPETLAAAQNTPVVVKDTIKKLP